MARVLWLIQMCVVTHSKCIKRDNDITTVRVPRLVQMCAVTHSDVCHHVFRCVAWLICVIGTSTTVRMLWLIHVRCDWFTCVLWLVHLSAVTHSLVCCDSFTCVLWLIQICEVQWCYYGTCAVTHSDVCRDSFRCVPWLVNLCAITHTDSWQDSRRSEEGIDITTRRALWVIHTCAVTHSLVCRDLFTCVLWLSHMCAVTHSDMRGAMMLLQYVYHDSHRCVPWRIPHMRRATILLWYVCRDSFRCVLWLIQTCGVANSQVRGMICSAADRRAICHVTQVNESCHADARDNTHTQTHTQIHTHTHTSFLTRHWITFHE